MSPLVITLVSAIAAGSALYALVPVAVRLGLVDDPDGKRKLHAAPTPLVGGIALLTVLALAASLTDTLSRMDVVFLGACGVMVLVGLLDDVRDLRASTRLVTEIAIAGFVVIVGGLNIGSLGNLIGLGTLDLGVASPVFTILAVTAAVNAFNMLDGIDGLSASVALAGVLGLLVASLVAGTAPSFTVLALVGALPVYLVFNLVPHDRALPKCFLGDSGAKLLGLALAWELIHSAGSGGPLQPVTVLWLAAVPLFDTLFVMSYRVLHGRSPMAGDRNHVHHLLQDVGISARAALVIVSCLAITLGGTGLALQALGAPESTRFAAIVALFLGHGGTAVALHHARQRNRMVNLPRAASLRAVVTGEFRRQANLRAGEEAADERRSTDRRRADRRRDERAAS